MPNIDLWGVIKVVLILAVVVLAIAAVATFVGYFSDGLSGAFHTAMTQEFRWTTQNEVTGGEWIAEIFAAVPILKPTLQAMSGVLALVLAWLGYVWLRRVLSQGA